MKKRWCLILYIASSFASYNVIAASKFYSGPAFSAQERNFSKFDQDEVKTSKVYYSSYGYRTEFEGAFGAEIIIVNYQHKKAWTVVPSQKWMTEIPMGADGQSDPLMPFDEDEATVSTLYDEKPCLDFDLTKKLGTQSVNGRQSDHWVCGQTRTKHQVMQWYDPKIKMVIKEEMENGDINELNNIKLGSQNASLFNEPNGYRKLTQQQYMQIMQKEIMQQVQKNMMQP